MFAALLPFLARQGVTDASLYPAEILGLCAPTFPDSVLEAPVLNSATNAMEKALYSAASTSHAAIMSQWGAGSMTGATVSGAQLAIH